jgi:hypothetical protein
MAEGPMSARVKGSPAILILAPSFLLGSRQAIDRILPVRTQIRKAGVLVDAEVVKHASAPDNLRLPHRIEGVRFDLHPHEQLFCGVRVVEVTRLRGILSAIVGAKTIPVKNAGPFAAFILSGGVRGAEAA